MVTVTLSGKDGDVVFEMSLEQIGNAKDLAKGMGESMAELFKTEQVEFDTALFAVMLLAQEMVKARSDADRILFQGDHL